MTLVKINLLAILIALLLLIFFQETAHSATEDETFATQARLVMRDLDAKGRWDSCLAQAKTGDELEWCNQVFGALRDAINRSLQALTARK